MSLRDKSLCSYVISPSSPHYERKIHPLLTPIAPLTATRLFKVFFHGKPVKKGICIFHARFYPTQRRLLSIH